MVLGAGLALGDAGSGEGASSVFNLLGGGVGPHAPARTGCKVAAGTALTSAGALAEAAAAVARGWICSEACFACAGKGGFRKGGAGIFGAGVPAVFGADVPWLC